MMAFNGRSKVIMMLPILKYVGLAPIWSNFPDVRHFHTDIFKLFISLLFLLIQQSPSHRGIDSDSTNLDQILWACGLFTHHSIYTL